MSTFVDTSGLYAFVDADDVRHAEAHDAWRRIADAREERITTNYALVETVSLIQARLGLPAVRTLVADITPVLRIHWVDSDMHQVALTALLTAGRRQLSLVDCVSFEAMRRLEIRRAFAFDHHFAAQGFEVVP